jgi:hypothetical protein
MKIYSPILSPITQLTGSVGVSGSFNINNYDVSTSAKGEPLWTAAGSVVVGSTGTAPTKSNIYWDESYYRQVGPRHWEYIIRIDKGPGGTNGNGDYLFPLPAAMPDIQNFGLQQHVTGLVNTFSSVPARYSIASSYGTMHHVTSVASTLHAVAYDARNFRILVHHIGVNIGYMRQNWFELGSDMGIMFYLKYQSV